MFDYSAALHQVIADIASTVSELGHVEPDRLWTAVAQTRAPGVHGVYASVLPLRFKEGAREVVRRGVRYRRPPLFDGEVEILYIITFYLPRFANLSFDQKLKTIFHELYHLSPEFNGDLRRFPGKKYAHGASRKKFDERLQPTIVSYLQTRGTENGLLQFLRQDFDSLMKEKGRIIGRRVGRMRCTPSPTACPQRGNQNVVP